MGLADLLGYANNPFYKAISPYSNTITGAGVGLASGRNWTEGIQNAIGGAAQGNAADIAYQQQLQKEQEETAKLNRTIQFLQQKHPDLAQAVESGFSISDAFNEAFRREGGGAGAEAPSNVREWEYYNKLPPEQKSEYLRMKRTVPYLDLGTEFAQPDPANPGQIAGSPITINNEQAAFDTATGSGLGKANAENVAAAESMASKLPGLKQVVTELGQLADKATYTQGGKLWDDIMRETGQIPSEGALARTKYMAMVDNQVLPLLRDTFGAAFTVQEGESLRATLGAPDKSPAEKKAVLEAFIEQKIRDVQAMQSRIPGSNVTSTGVQWSFGP